MCETAPVILHSNLDEAIVSPKLTPRVFYDPVRNVLVSSIPNGEYSVVCLFPC